MRVLTVYKPATEHVAVLNFDEWDRTGKIIEADVHVPLSMELQSVSLEGSHRIIGIPREMEFRCDARTAGYKIFSAPE